MDFPKPIDKRPQLALSSKSGLITKIEEREALLKQRADELAELERNLLEQREHLDASRHELEDKSRALIEAELLLKNQRMLHQKQFARLMEQNDLVELRAELEKKEDDFRKKEDFFNQTQQRLSEQLSAREADLKKREAWVSAEHEKATSNHSRRLQAIVFTDVVSYSALMQANESRTIQKVRTDLQRMQTEGAGQGGMLINTMGDGMLMIFPSAIQAVRFSLAMQNTFNRNPDPDALRHRFGIHIADVALLPDGGIAGDGVNIAARLESKAPNGGICLSEIVYFIVKGKLTLPPSEVEEIALKNIAEPVAVYKYSPEVIRSMPDSTVSTPPQAVLTEEERTAVPFPFSAPADAGRPVQS
ncbi:Adenylate and Guanylate cyclase catalytic domain protein [Lacunisphaera limnophila]|uniref:Adenylate and Guanylate cyclase catalytic domain protein n=1 Tax=Lacunisphaera limnophila TaxID=1838286 RepID=A0A1D8AXM3_9BACT|nr:adenylate/guanylate cyclase domain-containing protein [Lacunisphaera limnophila]AOS45634.1 Adenylate and Guanylate cyclase catalytic domain protein [Lacunisphaera limnophila]